METWSKRRGLRPAVASYPGEATHFSHSCWRTSQSVEDPPMFREGARASCCGLRRNMEGVKGRRERISIEGVKSEGG